MYIFAYICLLLGLLFSLGGSALALLRLWSGRSGNSGLIGKIQLAVTAFLLLASACLLHALFWEDYRLEYVASYTDAVLPMFYRLTAFWAGQPGSMLFWALATSICGSSFWLMPASRRLSERTSLWFWAFFYANMAFFCLVLSCWSNPFIMLSPVPADGNGLNPLLQNPGMIFHPPLLFLGYAGFTVPACLGLAQSLAATGDDAPWFRVTRPFIMCAWILLTAGIVLGAWWAYMELGWGGYWAWDPVENASLLPWLVATACLHVLAVQNYDGKLARTSVFLIALTVISAFFATYLTRSGVIQSVHAFGDGGVGTPLLVLVISALLISAIGAFARRGSGKPLASPLSREGALVLASWIFLALGLIILLATMWPVFSRIGGTAAQGLDASFYNRVCLPPASLLVLLLSICSWLGWKGGLSKRNGMARIFAICGAFLASIGAIWASGYRHPVALLAAAAAISAMCSIVMHVLDRNVWKSPKAISAMGAHFGLAILVLGVAFSGPYTTGKDLVLSKGQTYAVGPYTIILQDVSDGNGHGYDFLSARLRVNLGDRPVGELAPERRMYAKFGDMQFSEVDVISTLGQDIYASLLGMDEDYRVLVRISIEPLVNWIWIGGALMCVLPIFGIGHLCRRRQDV